jgi:hypothetical protein
MLANRGPGRSIERQLGYVNPVASRLVTTFRWKCVGGAYFSISVRGRLRNSLRKVVCGSC